MGISLARVIDSATVICAEALVTLPYVPARYTNINATKSPASGADNGSVPRLKSHVGSESEAKPKF